MKKAKKWYDYLWIVSALYLILGFFNILFAWLGLICFFVPLAIAIISGNKAYCNRYCGRGQLFQLLGERLHLSRNRPVPRFLKQKWFRYGFLIFFLAMFLNMLLPPIWSQLVHPACAKWSRCCGHSVCPGTLPPRLRHRLPLGLRSSRSVFTALC